VPHAELERLADEQAQAREAEREKLERMTSYAHGAQCRWKMILEYFGAGEDFGRCGHCDNCVNPVEVPADLVRDDDRPREA
jgi:ATP-dependent DNA helicase RecQ